MIGAIPGGVDVERTYHLMDMYIQECEQLQTLKEINDLQYQMPVSYTHLVLPEAEEADSHFSAEQPILLPAALQAIFYF